MTNLRYLYDTYALNGNANVVAVGRNDRGAFVVFDETIFYPQGGGQPADRGHIEIDGDRLAVTFVGFEDGRVHHYIPAAQALEKYVGCRVSLTVDPSLRMANARLHTGGHHVSHVIEGLDRNLVPIKGYHFSDGAYVEFVNERGVDPGALIDQANERLSEDVRKRTPVSAQLSDFASISVIRPQLAQYVPKEKPSRMVTIGDYDPLPCGGTHVRDLGELESIVIIKCKKQKSNVRVSYRVGK